MSELEKSCAFCGSIDDITKLRTFDLTGRWFCSLSHFQEYYKEHNSNTVKVSHDMLNAQEILKITDQENAFNRALEDYDDERKLKCIEDRILTLKRLQESIRLSEIIQTKHKMKIREKQESEKTERYRKEGCNSDLELKEKRVSMLGRRIMSYKKMNMKDEQIIILLTSITKFSREEIIKEMNEL